MVRYTVAALVFILGLQSAFASTCEQAYKKYLQITVDNTITYPFSSTTQVSSGLITSLEGSLVGLSLTDTNFTLAKVVLGGAHIFDTYFNFQDVMYNLKTYKDRVDALRLIQESYLGLGLYLDELTDEINQQQVEGDFAYDSHQIASLIKQADQEQVFCPQNQSVFTRKKLAEYVKEELNLQQQQDQDI